MTRITRRHLLAGAGASSLAACAGPFPTDQAEAAFPPIGEFVEAAGERVHFWRRCPEGVCGDRVPVVLIHGASGNLRDFTFSIAPAMARAHPVIAVDRPGFGYTTRRQDAAKDPRVQASILRAAMEKIGVDRAIILGHSYGAAVAMAWAVQAPSSVAGIIPVSGVTMPYRGAGRFFSAVGLTSVITWAYTQYIKSIADDGGVEAFLARVFRPQSVPEGYEAYVGAPLALRENTLAANGADFETLNGVLFEMAPSYAGLDLPVEIVHGQADFIEPSSQGIPLHASLKRSRLTLLDGVGHMAHHAALPQLLGAARRIEAESAA
ncbi:MAG: alpha/beta fold hydrolase [Pseudomonadota bacterium]